MCRRTPFLSLECLVSVPVAGWFSCASLLACFIFSMLPLRFEVFLWLLWITRAFVPVGQGKSVPVRLDVSALVWGLVAFGATMATAWVGLDQGRLRMRKSVCQSFLPVESLSQKLRRSALCAVPKKH